MKKTIITLSLIASSMLFAANNSYTTEFLDSAVADVYDIHDTFKSKMDKILNSDAALEEYSKEVSNLESKISTFLANQTNEFSSKKDAQKALDDLVQLSSQTTVLAKTIAYLASHEADNANESYNNTVATTSKTILRLSDDIGAMADRIGEMADRIGVMADRIVTTQEIQSKNYNATLQLVKYAMDLSSNQTNSHSNMSVSKQITSMPNNMNSRAVNSNMQQGTIHIR